MTNAQVALRASVESFTNKGWGDMDLLNRAEAFKEWLDEQDSIDKKKAQQGEMRTYGDI